MDPITAVFIFLVTVGLGEEIKEREAEIQAQQVEIAELEQGFMRLSAAHSSFYAGQKLNNTDQQQQIDNVQEQLDFVEKYFLTE